MSHASDLIKPSLQGCAHPALPIPAAPPITRGDPKRSHTIVSKEATGSTKARGGGQLALDLRGVSLWGKQKESLSLPLTNLVPSLFPSWRGEKPS